MRESGARFGTWTRRSASQRHAPHTIAEVSRSYRGFDRSGLDIVGPRSRALEKSGREPPWAFPAQSRTRKCQAYEFGRALGWGVGRLPALANRSRPCPEPIPGRSWCCRAHRWCWGWLEGGSAGPPAAWKPARDGGGAAPGRVKRWQRGGSSA